MTEIQCIGLISTALGAIGTSILFLNSYAFEPLQGGMMGSPELNKSNERIRMNNLNRAYYQKIGFALLCVSFVIQAITYFL